MPMKPGFALPVPSIVMRGVPGQQTNLFKTELKTFLSDSVILYRLTDKINWEEVHTFCEPYCSRFGNVLIYLEHF